MVYTTGISMIPVIQQTYIQPIAIHITTLIPTITIGGTDGTGVHTIIVGTILTIHTTIGGTGAAMTGMHTTGTIITGMATVHTTSTSIPNTTITICEPMACFQQQEQELQLATTAQPVQPMVAIIHVMDILQ